MASRKFDLREIGRNFQLAGDFVSAAPYGNGHINDTFAANYNQGGAPIRYLHQRINHNVFKEPVNLMDNVQRVTRHLRQKLEEDGAEDPSRRSLTTLPSRDGLPYHRDADGNIWRTYIFIENARTWDVIETPDQARQAARAFGLFQRQLIDLPGPRLHETVPAFHDTPARFAAFEEALANDRLNRVRHAKAQIDFAFEQKEITRILLDLHARGEIPERITHNDTKLNNVMLDNETGEGVCVIDLDTVMPGLALYDFGDMVRTATSPAPEDEKDLTRVLMQMPMFEALAEGYLSTATFLNKTERSLLPFAGRLITFEIGLRFLTDYLAGDHYFKVHREGHNLDRARTQFALAASIESQEKVMDRVIRRIDGGA